MTLIIYPHFRSSATLNLVAFFDCFDTKEIKEKNTYKRKKKNLSLNIRKEGKGTRMNDRNWEIDI